MDNIKPVNKRPVQPVGVKPAQPVAKPVEKPAEKPVEKPAVKPVVPATPTAHKAASKAKKPISKKNLGIIAGVVAAIVLVVAIIVIVINSNNNQPDSDAPEEYVPGNVLTEEDKKVTQQTMDNVEINVEGYQHIADENGEFNAVVVTVKNTGDKRTCIAIDVAAKDGDDKILDMSSLYAEGIEPEQTQRFYLFVYSELTPDQLTSAKYDVYKAYTYTTEALEAENQE